MYIPSASDLPLPPPGMRDEGEEEERVARSDEITFGMGSHLQGRGVFFFVYEF